MSRKIKYQHTSADGVVHSYVVRVKTNATAEDIENAVRKDLRLRLAPPRKSKPAERPASSRPLSPAARATFAAAHLLSIPPGKGG